MRLQKKDNAGARKLRELFPDHGATVAIARELEVDQGAVSRWLRGDQKPHARFRRRLETLYAIDWEAWDEELQPPILVYPDEREARDAIPPPPPSDADPEAPTHPDHAVTGDTEPPASSHSDVGLSDDSEPDGLAS